MKNIAYAALLGLVITACGGGKEPEKKNDKPTAKKEEKATSVYAVPVKKTKFGKSVEVHGFVLSGNNIMVMPEAQGVIRSISVSEGSQVRKGQVIARVDTEIMYKNKKEAEKALELAEEIFKKQKNLFEQNVGSEIQYLQAKNNKESLEQRISTINSQIRKATIVAPISGKIEKVYPKVGEMASPAAPLVQIINTKVGAYIECDVSEAYFRTINQGDSVSIKFPTFGDEIVNSRISYKGNFINNSNRTFKIQVSLNTRKKDYPANLFAIVTLPLEKFKDVIAIPTNIIKNDGDNNYVFVVKDNKAVKRNIEILSSANNTSVVSKGLEEGEQVIVKAQWDKLSTKEGSETVVVTTIK